MQGAGLVYSRIRQDTVAKVVVLVSRNYTPPVNMRLMSAFHA